MRTRAPRPTAAARWVGAVLPLVVLGTLLAGCGDDSGTATDSAAQTTQPATSAGTTGEDTPSPAPEPQCGQVWVDGETLPGGYRTCYDGASEVEPRSRPCSFGKALLTHDDRFWSVRGGRITETTEAQLLDDKRYRAVLRICTA